jgi:hypothetical protein
MGDFSKENLVTLRVTGMKGLKKWTSYFLGFSRCFST